MSWRKWQYWLRPERLVFIDETCAKTNMTRLYGRSVQGQRLHAGAPAGHWNTTTFIAGLRSDGLCAPMVMDGPMDGAAFEVYVEHFLLPSLQAGDVVVMDNLSCHKNARVREMLKKKGVFHLFLPAYSPDLNPIEQVFAKLKAWLRKCEPRSKQALHDAIACAIDQFTPQECRNYFRNAGYGPI